MIQALITYLLANVAGISDRIYPGIRPQGSDLPALVVNLTSRVPEYADDGEAGLSIDRVQIDSWAENYTAARNLSVLVFNALSAYSTESDTIGFVELINERDLHEVGSGQADYPSRVMQDYRIVERM